jgi:pimeloyl-ACP methyl ester carboxylesterase
VAEGRVLLVGSSMGGWLMLHAAMARPDQVAGLVGIAAAPDFTHWGYTQEQKQTILNEGRVEIPSAYSDQPSVTTRALWESGESMRLLHAEIPIDCPVHLLHGQLDEDVPWTYALELMKLLRSAQVQTTIVKDGDHRLSREADIALLIGTVRTMLETL